MFVKKAEMNHWRITAGWGSSCI